MTIVLVNKWTDPNIQQANLDGFDDCSGILRKSDHSVTGIQCCVKHFGVSLDIVRVSKVRISSIPSSLPLLRFRQIRYICFCPNELGLEWQNAPGILNE